MKLQLDTDNKIVRIEESINLGTFVETLKTLLPNGTWKSFTLEVNNIINWGYPIIVERPTIYEPYKVYPWITYIGDSTTLNYNSGTYNIEV